MLQNPIIKHNYAILDIHKYQGKALLFKKSRHKALLTVYSKFFLNVCPHTFTESTEPPSFSTHKHDEGTRNK